MQPRCHRWYMLFMGHSDDLLVGLSYCKCLDSQSKPELFFGIVGAVGTDL